MYTINQVYNGNILEKLLQIEIPDVEKPDVIKKIMKEWNKHQSNLSRIENKIKKKKTELIIQCISSINLQMKK